MGLLEGRVVVVTGSAQAGSIGEAIARRVGEEGGTPIVTSRKADAARAAAARLARTGARADGDALDVTDDADVARFAQAVLDRHGRVDGIVHNAGYPITKWERPFMDVPPAEYARVFDVDVVGAIRLTRALLPTMVAARQGSIIFTSSLAGLAGYEFLHEFAPAKAGVLGIMRDLAVEFGRAGVRSNAVAYGNIKSEATWGALTPEQQEALGAESSLRRWGEPVEAANASIYLLSDLSSFVNGQTLVVDGGTFMR